MISAIHSSYEVGHLVGLILVIACLIAAAVLAYRAAWIAALALCGVALIAAVLLL